MMNYTDLLMSTELKCNNQKCIDKCSRYTENIQMPYNYIIGNPVETCKYRVATSPDGYTQKLSYPLDQAVS